MHNDDQPFTDIQTLINNMEPVGMLPVDLVLKWTQKAAMEHLRHVANGDAFKSLGDVGSIDLDDFVRWEQRRAEGRGRAWPLKLAALSGCHIMFPRFIQQLGDQWLEELSGGGKVKVVNFSGAYALVTPSEAVKPGTCSYSHKYGWLVNPEEAVVKSGRNTRNLVDAAGTMDFDDKMEGFVFKSKRGEMYVLLVRKPNGPDEKYLLKFEGDYPEHWEIPVLKVSNFKVPTIKYGEMKLADPLICGYEPMDNSVIRVSEYNDWAVLFEASKRNISLGSTVNWVMLETGVTGKAPAFMKLAISDVTDIAQTGKNSLSPDDVKDYNDWLKGQFKRVVGTYKIPPMLIDRVPEKIRPAVAVEDNPEHPINKLASGLEAIKKAYIQSLSKLVAKIPAPDLGRVSTHYMAEAQKVVSLWGGFWGNEALVESTEDGKVDLAEFWAKFGPIYNAIPATHRDLFILSLARLVYARGMVERDGVARWRDGLLFAIRKEGKGLGDMLIEAMQSRGLMYDFSFDSQYGLIVSPTTFIPAEPHRVSVAVNGITHTMGAAVSRQLVERGEVGTDDRILEELQKIVKGEQKKIAAEKPSIFSKVIVTDYAFSDGEPRKGIFIVSELARDGLYRIGVLADEYTFLANGEYEVSQVCMNGRQLIVVLK